MTRCDKPLESEGGPTGRLALGRQPRERWCALCFLACLALPGCGSSDGATDDGAAEAEEDAGTDTDADISAEVEAEVLPDEGPDADDDADMSAEAEAEAEAEGEAAVPCEPATAPAGTWCDPTSGLLWENPASDTYVDRAGAVAYCDALSLGGHDDWMLPSIGRLRTLLLGCAATVVGGACGVDDACTAISCRTSVCNGCVGRAGPGTDGCYWDPALGGFCSWYWSSSVAAVPSTDWYIVFDSAHLGLTDASYLSYVRCVRHGP